MQTVTDYSKSSLQELAHASQYIDREKYPDQYQRLAQEIQQRGDSVSDAPAEPEQWAGFIPLAIRLFSHGLAGFTLGIFAYIFFFLLLRALPFDLSGGFIGRAWFLYGTATPVIFTILGTVRAVRQPIAFLSRPWVIVSTLALATLPFVLVLFAAWAMLSVRVCG